MDNYIDDHTVIKRSLIIGDHNAIDPFFYCSVPLEIGSYVHISSNVSVIGGEQSHLRLDDFSFVATGSRLICGSEDFTADTLMSPVIPENMHICKYAPIVFEKYSGVGANCVVLPGVTLAEGSVVGAGSVVTKSTEPWGVYVGSPARKVKTRKHKNAVSYAKRILGKK